MMLAVTFTALDFWLVVAIVVLILVSAVLALSETAVTRMSRAKAQAMVDQGIPGAERVREVVVNLERDLNSLFLVVLVAQTVQASLTGVVAVRLFGGWGVAIATVVNVVVVFVIAEAAPKTWALQHPERAAVLAAPIVAFVGRVFRLAARGLIGFTNVILPGKGLKKGPFVTEEEVLALAEEAAEAGGIERSEHELIASIIDFGDTVAREIMVPRTEMVTMQADFRVSDMLEVAILNGMSRFPVYVDSVDDVIGIAYAKDLMRAERDGGGERPVRELVRPAMFVPETKRVAELLREMQTQKNHMTIVIDEYGGTAGLATLEDLLEELVGEIHDEFDVDVPAADRDPVTGDLVVHDPSENLDDLNETYHLRLPTGDWDSLGGLVYAQIGRVPVSGDEVCVEGYKLVVEDMDGRRIARVRIVDLDGGEDPDGAGDVPEHVDG
jgi:CBS domain containing-hemolysin-like protein